MLALCITREPKPLHCDCESFPGVVVVEFPPDTECLSCGAVQDQALCDRCLTPEEPGLLGTPWKLALAIGLGVGALGWFLMVWYSVWYWLGARA